MAITNKLARQIGPKGGFRLSRQMTGSYPRILMYHRFSQTPTPGSVHAELFEQQLRYLARYCRIVPLSDLVVDSASKRGISEKPLAAITVDDGYADFYEIAFPILKKLGVPATFYVATSFVDHRTWLWHDRLQWCLDHARTPVKSFKINSRTVNPEEFRHGGKKLWQFLVSALLEKPGPQIEEYLKKLQESLGVKLPETAPTDCSAVNWEQLRLMQEGGIEIGGHTQSHYSLGRLSPKDCEVEVRGCSERLSQELGEKKRPFCYPNGQPSDIPSNYRALLEYHGFNSATVAFYDKKGICDPFAIRRHGIGDGWFSFEKTVSGVDRLGALLLGRNSRFDWGDRV